MMSIRDIEFETRFLQSFNYSKLSCRIKIWTRLDEEDEFAGRTQQAGSPTQVAEIWGRIQQDTITHRVLNSPLPQAEGYYVLTRYNPILLETNFLLSHRALLLNVIGIIDIAMQRKLLGIVAVQHKQQVH